MSPMEMLLDTVHKVHFEKGVKYKDINKTLKHIVEMLEELEE